MEHSAAHYILILHIMGIIFWVGGLLTLTKILSIHVQQDEEIQKKLYFIENKIYKSMILSGAFLTLLSGILLLVVSSDNYMSHIWMHLKLTFVIAIFVINGIIYKVMSDLAKNHQKRSPKMFKIIHGVTDLMVLLILAMIYLRPEFLPVPH